MQSVTDTEGRLSVSVYLDEKTGTYRYRRTAYLADGSSRRINGSAEKWNNTERRAEELEAEELLRLRKVMPGQEAPTKHTAITPPASPPKPLTPTVRDFHGVYLESARIGGSKPSTMKSKEGIFRTHILPRLGDMRLDEVTYAVIEDFKVALAQTQAANTKHQVRTLAPKTLHNILVCLSDMLGVARKRGLIAATPDIDWIKIPPSEFDFLDFAEAEALIAAADPDWRTLMLVATRTGMRMGELIGLRWEDVDLSAGRIHVRRSYVDGVCGLPKSGKPREIPLGDDVIEALGMHRHERGPFVFCDAGGGILTSGKMAQPLKRACARAKLREIGWHVLRHTFASHLVMRSVTLKVIQELLGHASILTTMRYAHVTPTMVRDAVRVLDRGALSGPAPVATPPGQNSGSNSAPTSVIAVEVATNWRDPAPDDVTN